MESHSYITKKLQMSFTTETFGRNLAIARVVSGNKMELGGKERRERKRKEDGSGKDILL
jgi:hypothetical protein